MSLADVNSPQPLNVRFEGQGHPYIEQNPILLGEFLEKHGAALKSGMKKVVKSFDEMDERFTDAEAEAWAESLLLRHRLSGKKGG